MCPPPAGVSYWLNTTGNQKASSGDGVCGKTAFRAQSRVEKGREWLGQKEKMRISSVITNQYFNSNLTFVPKQILECEIDLLNY